MNSNKYFSNRDRRSKNFGDHGSSPKLPEHFKLNILTQKRLRIQYFLRKKHFPNRNESLKFLGLESCKGLFYKEYVLWKNFKFPSNFPSNEGCSPENLVLGKIINSSIALTSTILMDQICLRTDIIFNYCTCFSSLHFFRVFIRFVCSSSLLPIMIFICFIPIKAAFTSSSISISPVLEKPKRYVAVFVFEIWSDYNVSASASEDNEFTDFSCLLTRGLIVLL